MAISNSRDNSAHGMQVSIDYLITYTTQMVVQLEIGEPFLQKDILLYNTIVDPEFLMNNSLVTGSAGYQALVNEIKQGTYTTEDEIDRYISENDVLGLEGSTRYDVLLNIVTDKSDYINKVTSFFSKTADENSDDLGLDTSLFKADVISIANSALDSKLSVTEANEAFLEVIELIDNLVDVFSSESYEDITGEVLYVSFNSDAVSGQVISSWISPIMSVDKALVVDSLTDQFVTYLDSNASTVSKYNITDIDAKAAEVANKIADFIIDGVMRYKIENKQEDVLDLYDGLMEMVANNDDLSDEAEISGREVLEPLLANQGNVYQLLKGYIVGQVTTNIYETVKSIHPLIGEIANNDYFSTGNQDLFQDKIVGLVQSKASNYFTSDISGLVAEVKAISDFTNLFNNPDNFSEIQELGKYDFIKNVVDTIKELDIVQSTTTVGEYTLTEKW